MSSILLGSIGPRAAGEGGVQEGRRRDREESSYGMHFRMKIFRNFLSFDEGFLIMQESVLLQNILIRYYTYTYTVYNIIVILFS
jgi:hypothetical protein